MELIKSELYLPLSQSEHVLVDPVCDGGHELVRCGIAGFDGGNLFVGGFPVRCCIDVRLFEEDQLNTALEKILIEIETLARLNRLALCSSGSFGKVVVHPQWSHWPFME